MCNSKACATGRSLCSMHIASMAGIGTCTPRVVDVIDSMYMCCPDITASSPACCACRYPLLRSCFTGWM